MHEFFFIISENFPSFISIPNEYVDTSNKENIFNSSEFFKISPCKQAPNDINSFGIKIKFEFLK